ncbi:SDR family NAD(P)-dependent oxidoreductase [Brevibacillus sp. B_LB10_24]|uniref:SDR family NAD(P)-dependent oxidoreductase n=1 Tax=Brevibacillus sp. B_LB10_24 TaxID=3380645 RepID=UPI0038BDDA8B
MDAKRRIVVITGGSGGLGLALARLHLKDGDHVVITGRDPDKLLAAGQALNCPSHLDTYPLQIDDNGAVRRFAAWVQIRFGGCDILYNNAGSTVFKPFLEMSLEEINETIRGNVDGLIYMTRAFLPMMVAKGRGRLVNVASLAGSVATAKASVYAASKAAVIRFSEGLRHELSGTGVSVTCVMPGPIDTPFLDAADPSGGYRSRVRRYLLSPERTALLIKRAAKAKKPEIAMPFRLYVMSVAYQLMPAGVRRLFAPLLNRK